MVTKEKVLEELKTIIDPELNVNIVDLGLIYDIEIKPAKDGGSHLRGVPQAQHHLGGGFKFDVTIKMTLTTPGCPLSYVFEAWIPEAVKKVKGIKNVYIDLVWEPAWDPDKISDEAKENLGIIK